MPEYQGVDVQHPRIKEYVQNMIKQEKSNVEIVKVVGMPHEVVEQIRRDMKRNK